MRLKPVGCTLPMGNQSTQTEVTNGPDKNPITTTCTAHAIVVQSYGQGRGVGLLHGSRDLGLSKMFGTQTVQTATARPLQCKAAAGVDTTA